MDRSPFLERLSRLGDLDTDCLRDLQTLPMRLVVVAKRATIQKEGATPNIVQVLLQGWAARCCYRDGGKRRISGIMLPGEWCGDQALTSSRMDHSVVALTKCEIGVIEASAMSAIVAARPQLAMALVRGELLEAAMLRRSQLMTGDAIRGVSHLICELFERTRVLYPPNSMRLHLPLTQEEIGDAVGLTPVHVNRMMANLRERELLRIDGATIDVLDVEGLSLLGHFTPEYLS